MRFVSKEAELDAKEAIVSLLRIDGFVGRRRGGRRQIPRGARTDGREIAGQSLRENVTFCCRSLDNLRTISEREPINSYLKTVRYKNDALAKGAPMRSNRGPTLKERISH